MHRTCLAVSFACLALAAASCTSSGGAMMPGAMGPSMRPLGDDGVIFVASEDPTHPRLRYLDGQVSQNHSCAIRLDNKLNPKIPPVYVNGEPIGFC